jgi:hypothetical protein
MVLDLKDLLYFVQVVDRGSLAREVRKTPTHRSSHSDDEFSRCAGGCQASLRAIHREKAMRDGRMVYDVNQQAAGDGRVGVEQRGQFELFDMRPAMSAFGHWFMDCKTVRSILIVFREPVSTPRHFLEALDQPLARFFATFNS